MTTLLPVSASVELRADKTFRIRWQRTDAADYYRVLENPDGVSGYTAITAELDPSTDYFDHRVALHKRVNARYMVEACNTGGCTLSVQQLIEGSLEESIGYFKASNTGTRDNFGSAVSLSEDGNTLAVGAHEEGSAATGVNGDQVDDSAARSGAVYVFVRSNAGWTQQAYIKAGNTDTNDQFGSDISLSADGNTLAVGAPGEQSGTTGVNGNQEDNSTNGAGAAHVYQRSGGNWQQQAYLKASNTQEAGPFGFDESFGRRVDLSADGRTLAVGATGEDSAATGVNGVQGNNAALDSGAVYVFVLRTGNWQQQAYVKAAVNGSRFFGRSISLNANGDTLAIGVNDYVTADTVGFTTRGADARDFYGAVYVFVRSGESWEQQAFLRGLSGFLGSYGAEISLSADGNALAISEIQSVDVYERIGGTWQGQATLRASNNDIAVGFGSSISLSADGSTLAVGATSESSAATGLNGYQGDEISKEESGAAYVFSRGDGTWPQQAYVKASNSFRYNSFGIGVSLSGNGDTLAIGAEGESSTATGIDGEQDQPDGADAWGSGAVYLY